MSVPRFEKRKKKDEKIDSNKRYKETQVPRYSALKQDTNKHARGYESKRFKRFNPSGTDRNSEKSVNKNIRDLSDSIHKDRQNFNKKKDEYKKEIQSQLNELNEIKEEQSQIQLAIERRRMRNLAIDSQPKNIEIVQNYAKSEVKSDITSETNGIKNDDKNGLKLDFIEVKTEKITESGSKNETITLKPDQIAENGIRTSPVDENIENMFNLASPAPTAQSPGEPPATALAPADDAEGFYAFRAGDLLDGRYKALRFKGTGVFSSVFLVADAVSGGRRCVKVARSLDAMRQTALREAALLKKLQSKEMDESAGRAHCVRFFDSFEHRGHVCLVFEELSQSLRQLMRCGGVGLAATRRYTAQLCAALAFVRHAGLVHADVKPDNVLVSESRAAVKLCDFGSAFDVRSCSVTPYLCSRYYRPPEIILGCPYGPPVDMWSLGCVVYELYTGSILFRGATNNAMLRLFFELLGAPPKKLLRQAAFATEHFSADGDAFLCAKTDAVTGAEYRAPVALTAMRRKELSALVLAADERRSAAAEERAKERRAARELSDFVGRCLKMDPEKRMCPEEALRHSFLAVKNEF